MAGIPIIGNLINKVTGALSGAGTDPDPTTGRPEPLVDLANIWGPVHGLAAAGITAAVTLGVLSQKSGTELNKGLGVGDVLITGITSALAGLTPVLAAQTVAQVGRTLVTPIADPRGSAG